MNTFPLNFEVQKEQEMENSVGLPVVNGFWMVELGSSKGGHVGLSLRSMYQDLGIPMKIEIQSDGSTANFHGSIEVRTANEAH